MDAWLEVALEEYKTLREEILRSIDTQQTILRLGTAAAGIVPAVSVTFVEEEIPQGVFFLVFAPLVSYLILIVWMGEVLRLIRAGAHLRGLEGRINEAVGGQPLTWEYWAHRLQETGRSAPVIKSVETFHIFGILSMFSLIALASMVAGITVLHGAVSGSWLGALIAAAVAGTVICAAVLVAAFLEARKLRLENYLPEQPTPVPAAATDAAGTQGR